MVWTTEEEALVDANLDIWAGGASPLSAYVRDVSGCGTRFTSTPTSGLLVLFYTCRWPARNFPTVPSPPSRCTFATARMLAVSGRRRDPPSPARWESWDLQPSLDLHRRSRSRPIEPRQLDIPPPCPSPSSLLPTTSVSILVSETRRPLQRKPPPPARRAYRHPMRRKGSACPGRPKRRRLSILIWPSGPQARARLPNTSEK
jgi:hypothetical protein